jgi:hypothetical protein
MKAKLLYHALPLELGESAPAEYLAYAKSRLRAGGVMLADAPLLTFLETEMRNGDLRHVERRLEDVIIASPAA